MTPASPPPLLAVRNLKVRFPVYGGILRRQIDEVRAVEGVSFEVRAGETLGLVGESGSGKTTVGRAILNLLRFLSPDVRLEGEILLHQEGGAVNLLDLPRRRMLPYRAQVQMIFQDPYSSLNPRLTVREALERPLRLAGGNTRSERARRIAGALDRVGLQPEDAGRFPHEFSGGQRQRIGIARALITRPRLIIADEPVSALDVSVRAQVINLMQELQRELGLTYIFIAHDLSLVHHISDRIAVMYLGTLVELGNASDVYEKPLHPYSQALLAAVPRPVPSAIRRDRRAVPEDLQQGHRRPAGCVFQPRCPIARTECIESIPPLTPLPTNRHVACPFAGESIHVQS